MLLKGPERKSTFTADLTFTTSARSAWSEILRRTTAVKQRPLKLLLPAYIGQNEREGSGVFDPVRTIGSDHTFYPLDAALVPDVPAIERTITAGDIDVLLIVHYFGFVRVDIEGLKELCSRNGVILVEDCAHCCFLNKNEHGLTGDYSFYSLHKFFPTKTGGVLRRNGEPSGEQGPGDAAELDPCDPAVLEQLLRTDVVAVNRRRRENYAQLESALTDLDGVTPLWTLDEKTVPHNFPVLIAEGRREKLYFHLQEHGLITIALYYRLADEMDRTLYPISFGISDSILNLPVHQDTNANDLEALVREIATFIKS
jgi:dTDP-4-amino-4,6-dideoxygalactose transaminase